MSAIKTGTQHRLVVYNDSGLLEDAFSVESTGGNWGDRGNFNFYLGHNGIDSWFEGTIDEARVSSVARSTDWIDAEFESTKAGSTFVSFGGVEMAPATGGVLTNDTDSDGVLMDATLVMGPSNALSLIHI